MRSSRGKAPLRMTVASDEILTPLDAEGERARGGQGEYWTSPDKVEPLRSNKTSSPFKLFWTQISQG